MTFDDLRALADKFFVWPEGSGRQTVTTFSALLFAQHVLQLREKSLGTENNAGMDALRNAAQQALEALEYGQHTLKQVSENQWESRGQLAMEALKAALEQPTPPVEAQTEAEKVAYCAGWWAALESVRKEREQRDALLEALKKIAIANAMDYEYQAWARAAIAKAEGA